MAIRFAGETGDRQAVPLLVDRLEDEDDAVRFFAIIALERITGDRFGYDYARPASQRAKSVEQWRTYVSEGRHAAPRDAAMSHGDRPGSPSESSRVSIEGEAR